MTQVPPGGGGHIGAEATGLAPAHPMRERWGKMASVFEPRDVEVAACSLSRLNHLIGAQRAEVLERSAAGARTALDGAAMWNVSSTVFGGGVAEMLHPFIGYAKDAGLDARWVVIDADDEFFAITKRLHNRIHGTPGDEGALGSREADHYQRVLRDNAAALAPRVRPRDVVVLHDPQTAGLAAAMVARGAQVVWRCHIGRDHRNVFTEEAWAFLQPYLAECRAFVFTHAAFVPPLLATEDVWIIPPSIDPLSPKNRPLTRLQVATLLAQAGIIQGEGGTEADTIVGGAAPFSPSDRLVTQVSRWDRLKDMAGVLRGFADRLAGRSDARLALVGPAVTGVADDPEGADVLAECTDTWASLPPSARDAIRLVTLPMDDFVTNALMVNAIQRHASVVVQKSLEEGFGLTVTEAMWKSRPVVASAVGGIVDQIVPGTGVLLPDPADLTAFGDALATLLSQPAEMVALGRRARRRVREQFLTDRQLVDWALLLEHLAPS
jgi:trehalose synthase